MALWSNGLLLLLLDALGLLWLGLLALLLLLLLCKHNQFLVIAKHPLHQRGILLQLLPSDATVSLVRHGCMLVLQVAPVMAQVQVPAVLINR